MRIGTRATVQERDIDLVYDTFENSFYWPGDRTPDVRAQNLNTVDEVPDSNWFTNHPAEIERQAPSSGLFPSTF